MPLKVIIIIIIIIIIIKMACQPLHFTALTRLYNDHLRPFQDTDEYRFCIQLIKPNITDFSTK